MKELEFCPRCHDALGPNHKCIEITVHGDTQRRFMNLYGMQQHQGVMAAMVQQERSRKAQESVWGGVWRFLQEAW